MFRYLRTLGCRRSLAEEITQESFFRLHSAVKAGLRLNDARAWIFRVARNLFVDSRRERQRYWPVRGDDEKSDVLGADSSPDPEQQALERERALLIEQRMLHLPKLERECMRLRAEGLRYHEIAAALDISMTAAVESVRRALKRLGKRAQP